MNPQTTLAERQEPAIRRWLYIGCFAVLTAACGGSDPFYLDSEDFIKGFNKYGRDRSPSVSIWQHWIDDDGFRGDVDSTISISGDMNGDEEDNMLDRIRIAYRGDVMTAEQEETFVIVGSTAIRTINPSKNTADADRLVRDLYDKAKVESEKALNEKKGKAHHHGRYYYRLTYERSDKATDSLSVVMEIY